MQLGLLEDGAMTADEDVVRAIEQADPDRHPLDRVEAIHTLAESLRLMTEATVRVAQVVERFCRILEETDVDDDISGGGH